jgi:hypothetical protein
MKTVTFPPENPLHILVARGRGQDYFLKERRRNSCALVHTQDFKKETFSRYYKEEEYNTKGENGCEGGRREDVRGVDWTQFVV